jgi:chemotaxis protein MotB
MRVDCWRMGRNIVAGEDGVRPIIKKKVIVASDRHHGGAWKVAYADFVTAMMAFFLLLWLLGSTSKNQKDALADYFRPTIPITDTSGGGTEVFKGDSIFADAQKARSGQGGVENSISQQGDKEGGKDNNGNQISGKRLQVIDFLAPSDVAESQKLDLIREELEAARAAIMEDRLALDEATAVLQDAFGGSLEEIAELAAAMDAAAFQLENPTNEEILEIAAEIKKALAQAGVIEDDLAEPADILARAQSGEQHAGQDAAAGDGEREAQKLVLSGETGEKTGGRPLEIDPNALDQQGGRPLELGGVRLEGEGGKPLDLENKDHKKADGLRDLAEAVAAAARLAQADAAAEAARKDSAAFDRIERAFDALKEHAGDIAALEHLSIRRTPEGVMIEIAETDGDALFASGSAKPSPRLVVLMDIVGPIVTAVENDLAVIGHTDAAQFSSASKYTNWELSADRANAARRLLGEVGVNLTRFAKISGAADRDPIMADPFAPQNRRIGITLLKSSSPPRTHLQDGEFGGTPTVETEPEWRE